MAWADPEDTHNPSTGTSPPASWGDAVNAAIQWLAGDASNPRPSCRVYRSTNQTISDSTSTPITMDSERWDTGGLHSTVSNTSRITVPSGGGGKWLFGAHLVWNNTDTDGVRLVQLRLNGSLVVAATDTLGTTGGARTTLTSYYDLVATDYIELVVFQTSGSSIDVIGSASAGNYSPELWAKWDAL